MVMRVVSVLASGRFGSLGINIQRKLELELELKLILIQPHMAQKTMPNIYSEQRDKRGVPCSIAIFIVGLRNRTRPCNPALLAIDVDNW